MTQPVVVPPERPITSKDDDKLERSRFIERLASALVNPSNSKSTGVVVGITGPWGSGKSSILNLLQEHLKEAHPDALIVRFDPWLVSGRTDLIAEFLGELIGTIKADEKRANNRKKLVTTLADYGAQLAPIANIVKPGLGTLLAGGLRSIKEALSKSESLGELRGRLMTELAALKVPIIVLIDEIDRVEDDEIRSIAQLVRSVADFPSISYVLAYDPDRVIQALGGGAAPGDRAGRGRAYLEKIVQLQLPLPITFSNELTRLLNAEVSSLKSELRLPDGFENIPRYQKLIDILVEDVIETPRDIRRLVGAFHVLGGMLREEVDWIDLLAFCALMIKSPGTISNIRREPEDLIQDPASPRGIMRRMAREKVSSEEKISQVIPSSERTHGIEALLAYIFPSVEEESAERHDHADALALRRPLLTTLRLGLIPGALSRAELLQFATGSPTEIQQRLSEAYRSGTLEQLVDRLDDLYGELTPFDHVAFWQGVAAFVKKPDCEWITFYEPMYDVLRNLAEVLERAVSRKPKLRFEAARVFDNLYSANETELTAHWLRRHVFIYGLLGRDKRGGNRWFLTADQTEALAREMAQKSRVAHLSGRLLPCHWSLQIVYIMLDAGAWDDPCREQLKAALADDRAFDAFSLLLFGPNFTTEKTTIEKLCDYPSYIAKAKERLASSTTHETVRLALRKAVGDED